MPRFPTSNENIGRTVKQMKSERTEKQGSRKVINIWFHENEHDIQDKNKHFF